MTPFRHGGSDVPVSGALVGIRVPNCRAMVSLLAISSTEIVSLSNTACALFLLETNGADPVRRKQQLRSSDRNTPCCI
jgi:hypothetical protein